MWPTSHPHSVTENKLARKGGWLALQIIFLTQIIKYFLHRPGTKRRRCKKWWFMLLVFYLKWRKLLWQTSSQERDRGRFLCLSWDDVSAEDDMTSNRPGSRSNNQKFPSLTGPCLSSLESHSTSINQGWVLDVRDSKWCWSPTGLDRAGTGRGINLGSWGCWGRLKATPYHT